MTRIYQGQFREADLLLDELGRTSAPEVREEALWFRAISLRNQGRLDDALEALRLRTRLLEGEARSSAEPGEGRHEGQVLFEMGRYRDAAGLFESMVRDRPPEPAPGAEARQHVMDLVGLVTALAAAGDTARLTTLADSVERWGRQSAFGRDRRLHHQVRGLLHSARHDWAAAEAEFRAAIFSTTAGYTRTNLELARVLLHEGRPLEAVSILSAALHGPVEGSNLFVTRTELLWTRAVAWDAAQRPDSAAAGYRRVLADWGAADAAFRPRLDSILIRVAALERPRPDATPRTR